MTKSSFYHDGYRDGLADADYSPPDISVYAAEYSDGYRDAKESLAPFDYPFEGAREGQSLNDWER
tara:strand:- start:25 stop:219 length:195 start_codon:yes stop_codon:yes gene_type:complete